MDLHIHSNLSVDGVLSVEEILKFAQSEKIDCISITDHNTALAHLVIEQLNAKKIFSGKIINGVEIDVVENGITFEMLGYDFDLHPVQNWLFNKFGTVAIRQQKIMAEMFKKCDEKHLKYDKNFKWNPKEEYAHSNLYNNLLQYEKENKLFGDVQNFSDFYRLSTSDKNFPLFLDMSFLWASVKEVNDIIHKNGGKTFLAHPFGYAKKVDVDNLLKLAVENKIDGIEVYHPKHSEEQIKILFDFCHKNKLLISGGSDFHDPLENKLVNYNIKR